MKRFLQTRREFLSTGLKGLGLIAAGGYVPAFVARTARATGSETDANILVVIQLSGGNDGLNTVIPFADDLYHKARPTLGMSASQVLKLNDHLGLHPELAPLRGAFDAGEMAVIENVGYPNPNRSHFRSMEIWHTAGDSEGPREITGWLGRYFDAQCRGADPTTLAKSGDMGISIGKVMPQSFRNWSNVGIAVDNPETFQWNASGETVGLAKAQEAIFARLNQPGSAADAMRGTGLEGLGGIAGAEPETLDFLKHTAMNAILSGDRIRSALAKKAAHAAYPDSELGNQLQMISKLIAANFGTRVYYAHQGGFDTHSAQAGTHGRLLRDVAGSVRAFRAELRAHGNSSRVLVLAFSEFGRRVAENGSQGTDHGAAAPMFLFADKLKAGVHGNPPDLKNLVDGDVPHEVDFRQVYASVLEDWLGTSGEAVLKRKFAKASVI